MASGGAEKGRTGDNTMNRGAPRWFDTDAAGISQKTTVAAGLSLGIFLLALEGSRLSALMYVEEQGTSLLTTLISFLVLGAYVARLCVRPPHRPAPVILTVLAALGCSLGLTYYLTDASAPDVIRIPWCALYSICAPALVYFWVLRAMPFGRTFITRSFGMGVITLGCLSMLTIAFGHTIAVGFVIASPFIGIALLPFIDVNEAKPTAMEKTPGRWNALSAIAKMHVCDSAADAPSTKRARIGQTLALSLLRLVPFLCYALIFGNIHFSWVSQQDGSTGMWVQLGAATGSIICGLLAFALARLHWGRALESILNLSLAISALVALWLSTFLTSGYVFSYLVLLNIAQKLMLLLILLFGLSFARNARECTSLWAIAYFSFFVGTCVSHLAGKCLPNSVDIVTAIALAVVFVADIVGVILLYGGNAPYEDAANSNAVEMDRPAQEPAPDHTTEAVPVIEEATRSTAGFADFDPLPYTCHLIASKYDLTRREEEILQLLMRGRSAARISEALCISVATARTHQRNIYAKLGVHSQQDILDLLDQHDAGSHEA